jgi:hypothetical protein
MHPTPTSAPASRNQSPQSASGLDRDFEALAGGSGFGDQHPTSRRGGLAALLVGGQGLVLPYLAALILSLALIGSGFGWFGWIAPVEVRVIGYAGLLLVLTLAPIATLLAKGRAPGQAGTARGLVSSASGEGGLNDRLVADLHDLMQQSALSDDARRVLNRRRERELLCRAIEEDIDVEDWDAAMVLVRELAERFGYRAEAEDFRTRIEQARYVVLERRVGEATANLDGMLAQHRWDEARVEAARIGRLFPDSPSVEGLRHRVEQNRQAYKMDLERRFREAAEAHQAERAMSLLKELDVYLSEREAEPLREMARSVIGKARETLGGQFKSAVQDKDWRKAIELGERIMREFPNSRMAHEVRELSEQLRAKAGAGDPAPASA